MTTMKIGDETALAGTVTTLSGQSRAVKYIVVPVTCRLDSLAVTANTQSGNITLALYAAKANQKPGALIATTASTAMGAGLNTIAVVTPIVLSPGPYWIAAQVDNDVAIMNSGTGSGNNIGWFYALVYGAFEDPFNIAPTGDTNYWQAYASVTVTKESSYQRAGGEMLISGPGVRGNIRDRRVVGPGKLEKT